MLAQPFPSSLDAVLDQISVIAGRNRNVSELGGGLTNKNYRIQTGDGGDYVVRLSEASTGLLAIDRDNERFNTHAAAVAGVGAPVVEALPELGVLVVEFLPGRTLDMADIKDPLTIPRVAEAVRQLHRGPRFQGSFDMRQIRRYYLSIVQDRAYKLPDDYLKFQPQIEQLEAAMAAAPEPLVPCNNDLLAANFIDDGERIWIIDYEYAGMNEASFELGNIASEAFLAAGSTAALVRSYWGFESAHKLARAQAWSLLARYGWTLWASIQDSASDIDFDFWSWGLQKYRSACDELDGPRFDQILRGLTSDA